VTAAPADHPARLDARALRQLVLDPGSWTSWDRPVPPRDVAPAGQMAQAQGVRATDLWRAGIVDRVVPERPDAADEPVDSCHRLVRVLGAELAGLLGRDDAERVRSRLHRYRHLGS
jgi:hypothetical protein